MADRQTWLLICHAFNMDGVASSQTVTDKLPHLAAAGIEPIVISAPSGRRDDNLDHRQVFSPLPSGLRYELKHYAKYRSARWVPLARALLLPFYALEKLLLPFGSAWSWFIAAYREGLRAIGEKKPSLIYSSGGANSAHFAAWLLKRRTGLPWLAEVHDPMIHGDWKKGPFQYRWAAYVERLICRHADVAIWFTPTALARAGERNPELGARGHVLYPGANPPAHEKAPYRRAERFVLAHFGSLAPNRNFASTLAAIDAMLERHPQWRERFCLQTYGGDWDEVSEAAFSRMREKSVIERHGRLEFDPATRRSGRERVLRIMDSCDVLLLLHGEDAFCEEYFPSKLYEYLWTQRPILALVVRNADLEGFIGPLGHVVVRGDDVGAVSESLEALMERWAADDLADSGEASPYSTQAAVAKLVGWGRAAAR